MADPDHVEELDLIDKASVCLYRSGIAVTSFSMLLIAFYPFASQDIYIGYFFYALGLLLIASCVHVYDKKFRLLFTFPAWISLLLFFYHEIYLFFILAKAFGFITISAVALKEEFCFKIKYMKAIPAVFALIFLLDLIMLNFTHILWLAQFCLVGYLFYKKTTMPLHFDIGDKSKYQV